MSIVKHLTKKELEKIIDGLTADFYRLTNAFKYLEAIEVFERVLEKTPELKDNEDILCRLGMLYDHAAFQNKNKKNFYEKKALSFYKKALKINPRSIKATWGIGRIYWHNSDKKAVSYAKKAYSLAKRDAKKFGIYIQNIGLVYQTLGKFKEAERWLKKGADTNPKDWAMYLNLVNFYRYTKQFKKSKKYSLILDKLFKKESRSFKKTPWGNKISQTIKDAERELNKVKK